MTPLHLAIDKINLEIVKLLMSNPDIDINIKTVCFVLFCFS